MEEDEHYSSWPLFLFSFFNFFSLTSFDASDEISSSFSGSRVRFFFLSFRSLLLIVALMIHSLLEDALEIDDVDTIALPKTALSSAAVLFFKSFAAECFLYLCGEKQSSRSSKKKKRKGQRGVEVQHTC